MQIQNLEIKKGDQNWELECGMTCGSVDVILPNGTRVSISASKSGDWNNCSVRIHRLRDTEVTIFNRNTKLVKTQKRNKNTVWTDITTKEE